MPDYITTSTSNPSQANIQATGNLLIGGNITAYYSSER